VRGGHGGSIDGDRQDGLGGVGLDARLRISSSSPGGARGSQRQGVPGVGAEPKEGARGQGHEDGAGGDDGGASTEDLVGLGDGNTAQQGREGERSRGAEPWCTVWTPTIVSYRVVGIT
jgi:hypothetical protein